MLRLAMRSACLASSWYGPCESMEALQQLITADAWASLLRALRALLAALLGQTCARQYNAINIVSDILHVRPRGMLSMTAPSAGMHVKFHRAQSSAARTATSLPHVSAQIFYSLSERHTHLKFRPSDITYRGLPKILLDVLLLVANHPEDLPRLHREQARHLDTALLMVSLSRIQGNFIGQVL